VIQAISQDIAMHSCHARPVASSNRFGKKESAAGETRPPIPRLFLAPILFEQLQSVEQRLRNTPQQRNTHKPPRHDKLRFSSLAIM
jgi:hypothetical protein